MSLEAGAHGWRGRGSVLRSGARARAEGGGGAPSMVTRWTHLHGLLQAVGWPAALGVIARRMLRMKGRVRARSGGRAFAIRPLDSDLFVAAQIFGWREYHPGERVSAALNCTARSWRAQGLTPVVIDGGANVGYSSLYFADQYPEAAVIAVEPDPASFDELCANCAGVANIRPVMAALWSDEAGVALVDDVEQGSWSRQVTGGGQIPSRTLPGLLRLAAPNARPLIIKLDIEGAERDVCAACRQALREAACIMIEPHDFKLPGAGCLSSLYSALEGRRVDTLIRGENLIIYDSALVAA